MEKYDVIIIGAGVTGTGQFSCNCRTGNSSTNMM